MKKPKYKKVGGQAAEDQKQIRTSSWWINHPGSVHTVLQLSLIDTVLFISEEWEKGGGGMGVKRDGGLFLREGALIEDLRCCYYCFFCLSDVDK